MWPPDIDVSNLVGSRTSSKDSCASRPQPRQGTYAQYTRRADVAPLTLRTESKPLRGEVAPPDLSAVLIVQLGLVIEDLNRCWYGLNSGNRISEVQRHAIHRTIPWMAATLRARQGN
jgi:hypothetical protein